MNRSIAFALTFLASFFFALACTSVAPLTLPKEETRQDIKVQERYEDAPEIAPLQEAFGDMLYKSTEDLYFRLSPYIRHSVSPDLRPDLSGGASGRRVLSQIRARLEGANESTAKWHGWYLVLPFHLMDDPAIPAILDFSPGLQIIMVGTDHEVDGLRESLPRVSTGVKTRIWGLGIVGDYAECVRLCIAAGVKIRCFIGDGREGEHSKEIENFGLELESLCLIAAPEYSPKAFEGKRGFASLKSLYLGLHVTWSYDDRRMQKGFLRLIKKIEATAKLDSLYISDYLTFQDVYGDYDAAPPDLRPMVRATDPKHLGVWNGTIRREPATLSDVFTLCNLESLRWSGYLNRGATEEYSAAFSSLKYLNLGLITGPQIDDEVKMAVARERENALVDYLAGALLRNPRLEYFKADNGSMAGGVSLLCAGILNESVRSVTIGSLPTGRQKLPWVSKISGHRYGAQIQEFKLLGYMGYYSQKSISEGESFPIAVKLALTNAIRSGSLQRLSLPDWSSSEFFGLSLLESAIEDAGRQEGGWLSLGSWFFSLNEMRSLRGKFNRARDSVSSIRVWLGEGETIRSALTTAESLFPNLRTVRLNGCTERSLAMFLNDLTPLGGSARVRIIGSQAPHKMWKTIDQLNEKFPSRVWELEF